jgi:lipopolysaccharide transport system ATP-binding protein
MSRPVIRIENLSKQYRLGLIGTGTLSHDLKRWWAINIRRKEDPYLKIGETNDRAIHGNSEYVWALHGINLEIQQGEVLGIIGKNGAGKSTLLKILSRVTSPTTGQIFLKGRIASLLEVGTGFHPEMTGRENIFMNGSIMGMTKAEIRRKLDEIVDFAGVERYIDTPVKRYSSGMMVRLGFAIAAHLEPEILVVDEVLAVGDAEFQKKALGKMQEVSKGGGRTVLFVSHNMGSILQLCGNCVLLKNGLIDSVGKSAKIVEEYYNSSLPDIYKNNVSDNDIFIKKLFTCNTNGEPQTNFAHKEDIHVRILIGINSFLDFQNIGICLLRQDKKRVFTVNKSLKQFYKPGSKEIEVDFIIEKGLIAPMNYSFLVALNNRSGQITYELIEDTCPIIVYDDGTDFSFAEGQDYGCIILKDKWNLINN